MHGRIHKYKIYFLIFYILKTRNPSKTRQRFTGVLTVATNRISTTGCERSNQSLCFLRFSVVIMRKSFVMCQQEKCKDASIVELIHTLTIETLNHATQYFYFL